MVWFKYFIFTFFLIYLHVDDVWTTTKTMIHILSRSPRASPYGRVWCEFQKNSRIRKLPSHSPPISPPLARTLIHINVKPNEDGTNFLLRLNEREKVLTTPTRVSNHRWVKRRVLHSYYLLWGIDSTRVRLAVWRDTRQRKFFNFLAEVY